MKPSMIILLIIFSLSSCGLKKDLVYPKTDQDKLGNLIEII